MILDKNPWAFEGSLIIKSCKCKDSSVIKCSEFHNWEDRKCPID